MNEIMLSEILEKICVEEAAAIPAATVPRLSYRHKRKMKRIFSAYQENIRPHKKLRSPKRLILIVTVIFLAMFTATTGAVAIRGFNRKEQRGYTELLTVNAENCPKTIENVYYISELPEGFELYEIDSSNLSIYTAYVNTDTNRYFTFEQKVKEGYREHFDNEHQAFEELEIIGHYALYLNGSDSESIYGTIVWDNDDYVLEISGNFAKDELIDLVKSAKN